MQSENFLITCLGCGESSHIKILNGDKVMYIDHTPIIACRLRPDLKWGFQCICGNDSRLAKEEIPQAEVLVSGSTESIVKRIIKAAKVSPEKKFRMERG